MLSTLKRHVKQKVAVVVVYVRYFDNIGSDQHENSIKRITYIL